MYIVYSFLSFYFIIGANIITFSINKKTPCFYKIIACKYMLK